eukprot:TRINITY_DN76_c0_g1_i2.p1 TRINITY_DN76_c0_g1~~TRINITY_DN76_c0_g1_i2.p1  ORF type:complete len:281 (+),score=-18.83 TRINITY_DN76_c0_g1_i2:231-1073(+)
MVNNFTVTGGEAEYAGFFGVVEGGEVANLTIDCVVKGGMYAGAVAGYCDNALIYGCIGAANVQGKSYSAGMVAKNSGEIFKCCSVGQVSKYMSIPYSVIGLSAASLVLLAGLITALVMLNAARQAAVYPDIPLDPNAGKTEETIKSTGRSTAAININTDIKASSGTDWANVQATNPNGSTANMLAKIEIKDEELMNTIGKTGKVNGIGGNSSNGRVEIGTSGLITIGSKVNSIKLNALPDGTVLTKGKYNVIITLSYYDPITNKKQILETNSNATLEVES